MKEETVRKVMRKYFASRSIKIIPQRGAGADFLIEGKGEAIEVKGSIRKKSQFNRMLRQLWDYTFKFADVSLALPYDGLTLKRIEQLDGLNLLIDEAKNRLLRVYLVAPKPRTDGTFCVRKYKEPFIIENSMRIPSTVALGFKSENLDSTKKHSNRKFD